MIEGIQRMERAIIDAKDSCTTALESYRRETATSLRANRDYWGTLHTNAVLLDAELSRLLKAMSEEFRR